MRLSLHSESWAAARPFRITGRTSLAFDCLVVEVEDGGIVGRGEAHGVYYEGETLKSMAAQIEAVRKRIEAGIDRAALQDLLPPGGARCGLDAALWDLEAKRAGKRAWEIAGVKPAPVETVYTVSIDTPEAMAEHAAEAARCPRLKLKLDGEEPAERVAAVRAARPDARLMVDANQGFTFKQLKEVLPAFAEARVELVEQPLPRGGDGDLEKFKPAVPLCADESCLHLGELEQAARRYQYLNIKLDKTGGLTHALALAAAARDKGLGVMVGCMGGTSRAMAPTWVAAQLADWADLDGPLLLKADRLPGMAYTDGVAAEPAAEVWG